MLQYLFLPDTNLVIYANFEYSSEELITVDNNYDVTVIESRFFNDENIENIFKDDSLVHYH